MKNILYIWKSDLKRMTKSVVSIVLVIGLCVLPSMYGWMNVLSTLDPYSKESTARMNVAVVSADDGTELYGIHLNIGDTITDTLKTNDTLGWQFPDTKKEALQGVYSGDYYAAIVIPKHFSEQMVQFREGNLTHPKLNFYQNDKENIIAASVMETAKNTIQDEINGAFMGAMVEAAVTGANVSKGIGTDGQDVYDSAIEKVRNAESDLELIQKVTTAMCALTDSAEDLVGTTQVFLPEVYGLTKESEVELQDIFDKLETGQGDYEDVADAACLVLDQAIGTLDALETWTKAEMDDAKVLVGDSADALLNLKSTINDLNAFLTDFYEYIEDETPNYMEIGTACSEAQQMVSAASELLTSLCTWSVSDATGAMSAPKEYQYMASDPAAAQKYYSGYLSTISGDVQRASDAGKTIAENLTDLKKYLRQARDDILGMENVTKRLNNRASDTLRGISEDLTNLSKDLLVVEDNILEDISNCRSDIEKLDGDLTDEEKLDGIIDAAQDSIRETVCVLQGMNGTYRNAMSALSGYGDALSLVGGDFTQTRSIVGKMQSVLQNVLLHLLKMDENGALDHMLNLVEDDPETLAGYLSEPVQMETVPVYEIGNYGSASAPFYTLLALWAGALFTMALFRARVDKDLRPQGTKRWEAFFGRYLLIFCIGQVQALITGFGICFFIGIDCAHPLLFCLGCSVAALVFTLINFALAYSMHKVGMGISVIIILLQVAGTGGSFPIEVLPWIYQKLYTVMPFRFGLGMMREAVGGLYGTAYVQNLGMLLLYGLAAIPFGLLVARLYSPIYHLMEKSMEKTGMME